MSDFSAVGLDEVRRYWNERPCNLRHSPALVGSREYFDQVEARKYMIEPHILGFAQFDRWDGKNVLEIGCGIGTDTVNFARAGARVVAVDLSMESLKLAKRRVALEGLQDRVLFLNGNAEHLWKLVPHMPYDLVYSFGVIHHTPNPPRVIREVRKALAPDGEFRLMVYNRNSFKALEITKGRLGNAEAIAKASEAQTGCPVTYTYTQPELASLLERYGLAPVEMRVEHIFPYVIEDYVQYRYVKRPLFRWMPAPLFAWLEHQMGWHLCAVATKKVN